MVVCIQDISIEHFELELVSFKLEFLTPETKPNLVSFSVTKQRHCDEKVECMSYVSFVTVVPSICFKVLEHHRRH